MAGVIPPARVSGRRGAVSRKGAARKSGTAEDQPLSLCETGAFIFLLGGNDGTSVQNYCFGNLSLFKNWRNAGLGQIFSSGKAI